VSSPRPRSLLWCRQVVLDLHDSVHMRDRIHHARQVLWQQRSTELDPTVMRHHRQVPGWP
jgi:hypothetical protein